MQSTVEFHDEFASEYGNFSEEIQDALVFAIKILRIAGPALGRPWVDTLKASNYPNMKELRLSMNGEVWRAAFAFDPDRKAIILVAGNKQGKDQKRFYKQLIQQADLRFKQHLHSLAGEK